MATILVTGAAGFIGCNLVRVLLSETTHDVIGLDKLTYAGRPENLDIDSITSRFTLVEGDICDKPLVDELARKSDAVVHLAAESHNDRGIEAPEAFIQTNIYGTYVLLQAALSHGLRFHHVSTDEVYGSLSLDSRTSFKASTPYAPTSPYSASKAGADHLVRAWFHSFGLPITISNCSNNYGPYQHVEKFIPRQITNIIDGDRPKLYGDGLHTRDWIHVEDHCRAVLAILESGRIGETYLVGADGEATNLDVIRILMYHLNADDIRVDYVKDRPGHDRRYAIDATRLRSELGWSPRHGDLSQGLAETVSWYIDNESWWRPAKRSTELMYERFSH
ncbi:MULTISPECIES: dTDP-glucose 4,6-dehydratase [Auritidibacter]|uniref:dTDP-glucose 4,6-dehydratase n=1 Tax=Auritidibacter ignavus TaxID=678932 RepID=A0AAJ6AIA1_9MICC|nr:MULTISPECIES: dTDP-glucose 4,6-dehydratase [Auritidibacter]PXA78994.1 dTDP-glucose 4,6-dehydratase [Auritidibacter sp. NML120779]AXR73949.1 dTDP-glucose 4,6-dehydratase [Auritidibacter sp. NML130574]WGH84461.1 dTDP-glucose 4,6-dehydratase [Auritidibacter ignavus]WGH93785.1 dTDP-glucose 4,6-dehydratase [Auritidibacter ignavus]WHS27398.1 dTDP-glucose 4,6-dehydratase [Auritidibacter ignavus]